MTCCTLITILKLMKYLVKALIVILVVIFLPFWAFTVETFVLKGTDLNSPNSVMVLGAGILNGQPSKILQLRLDKTIQIYREKNINRILVSGDNRDVYYNEPLAMKNYLVKNGVPANIILEDAGGIRTFNSCKRASEEYNFKSLYLVSQAYHLARASVLCKNFGLEVIPVEAEDSCSPIICSQVIREIAASWLAVLNITEFY